MGPFTGMELSDHDPGGKWDWIVLALALFAMIVITVAENYGK